MANKKIYVNSAKALNMGNLCYMKLHKRMYLVWHPERGGIPYLHLVTKEDSDVSVTLTASAANEFLNYEMSFDTMLLLFSNLCIHYGQIKLPF